MSLNWAMLDPSRNPVPLPDEHTVLTVEKGAELSLTTPAGSKLKEVGKLVLTEQRLIFVSTNAAPDAPLQSLSVPLLHVISTSFQQPVFGANYFAFEIKPASGGGLDAGGSSGNARAELRFSDRGIDQFIGTLEKVRERAMYMRREQTDLEDSLRDYIFLWGAGSSTNVPGYGVNGVPPPPPGADELPPSYDA
ncbi:hypothetical protein BKA62DRAFT_744364 [Auriculariales sp. MPI-PUGE-AT-0066]|nr:hypothetical protein BKA62DRAFT_744364 [Auriculariales sp. MPI-PUGE-AT-0066]